MSLALQLVPVVCFLPQSMPRSNDSSAATPSVISKDGSRLYVFDASPSGWTRFTELVKEIYPEHNQNRTYLRAGQEDQTMTPAFPNIAVGPDVKYRMSCP